jgi:DNA-binding transcriptional ArsR family regulator
MNLEEVLSSRPRLKILKLIYQLGQLNISDLARKIKTNFSQTVNHLEILKNEGILEERVYGRIHLYRLADSPKAKAIIALIEIWENCEK